LQKDIEALESVQKRASKQIPEFRHLTYERRLEILGLTTLKLRRDI
jgi:ribonuclease P/MRP protein subunit RPP40